jgi:hypothetical protein
MNRVLGLGVQHAAVHSIYIHQLLDCMRLVTGAPPSALYAPHQLQAGVANMRLPTRELFFSCLAIVTGLQR